MTVAPLTPPQPLLEVSNLCVDFPSEGHTVFAVDDVSFTLAQGEITGLVGESGSGQERHLNGDPAVDPTARKDPLG